LVISTNQGIFTHEEARQRHIGGKIVGFFYWWFTLDISYPKKSNRNIILLILNKYFLISLEDAKCTIYIDIIIFKKRKTEKKININIVVSSNPIFNIFFKEWTS
jgi:hypothetical protein